MTSAPADPAGSDDADADILTSDGQGREPGWIGCVPRTFEQIESVTGSAVVSSGLVPDEEQIRPEDPNPCMYVTGGFHGTITVYVDPHGAEEFARRRDRDPRNTERVEGIGDEAFSFALASLYVRVGDGYFVLGTSTGPVEPGSETY